MQIRRRLNEEAGYLWRSMTLLGHELADNTYIAADIQHEYFPE